MSESKKLREKRLRREAESQRRAAASREALRRNLVTVIVAVVVLVTVVVLIMNERNRQEAGLVFGPAADEAGCSTVQSFDEQEGDHIPEGQVPSDYNSMPPTTGKMWEGQATGGFNEQEVPLPLPVHNLEHGQIVVYYDDLSDKDEANLARYADDNSSAVTAVPAPEGVDAPITLTAWTKLQSCDQISSAAIEAFRRKFQGTGPEGAATGPFRG